MCSLWKKLDRVVVLFQESRNDVRVVYCLYKLVARKIVCIFKRCATRLVLLVMVTVSLEYVAF